jgi:hypothetical protein
VTIGHPYESGVAAVWASQCGQPLERCTPEHRDYAQNLVLRAPQSRRPVEDFRGRGKKADEAGPVQQSAISVKVDFDHRVTYIRQ